MLVSLHTTCSELLHKISGLWKLNVLLCTNPELIFFLLYSPCCLILVHLSKQLLCSLQLFGKK
jgi:hypothetical protein